MKTFGSKLYPAVLLMALTLLFLGGCAEKMAEPPEEDTAALPPVSVFAGDLKDIELPNELSWVRNRSMAIKTESFNGGILYYVGNVEPLSLKDFVVNAMHNNKWKLVGESTSKDILLAFVKPNKTCMMFITETTMGKTELALYVTIDRTAASGLNPFGEAVVR